MAAAESAVGADWKANRGNVKSVLVLTGFRVAHVFARRRRTNIVVWVIGIPFMVLYRVLVDWVMNIEIPAKTQVGPGLTLWHGQGLVVHPATVIGRGVTLRQTTTIGPKSRDGVNTAAPVIGDGADIGSNVVIVGPVTIGAGAVVGAGSVVTSDVEPGAVVAGNPARPLGAEGAPAASEDAGI